MRPMTNRRIITAIVIAAVAVVVWLWLAMPAIPQRTDNRCEHLWPYPVKCSTGPDPIITPWGD